MADETQMTMNRVIHAAVRRDFERTAKALDSFRDGDATRAVELDRAWQHLAQQLTHHHEQEDTLIWPALEGLGVDPVLLGEMESEHQAMHDALVETSAQMTRLAGSARNEDATAAAEALGAHPQRDRAPPAPRGGASSSRRFSSTPRAPSGSSSRSSCASSR